MPLNSINGSFISTALAQARVAADAAQLNSDQAQLQADQTRLQQDQSQLSQLQRQTQQFQQTQISQALQSGMNQLAQKALSIAQAPQQVQVSQPTVNTSGQIVGQVINVVA